MPPPKSVTWLHFIRLSKETARCKACSKVLKTSGNTSNLNSHLKQKHSVVFQQLTKNKGSSQIKKGSTETSKNVPVEVEEVVIRIKLV